MAKKLLFVKTLTVTDIKKRLSVPTMNKTCFLNFGARHKVEFMVTDKNGREWRFGCSIRKKDYPKPVLSKGWLQFVRCWELAVGDEVIVYNTMDKAGMGYNRIEVIRKEVSPVIQNHDAVIATEVASYTDVEDEATITSESTDRAMAVASYTDVEDEATVTTDSIDQGVTYDETEGLHNLPGLMYEFISLKPDISEPKVINFFELGSQEQREMEYSSILTLHNTNMDGNPVTSSTVPYFKFL